MSIRKIYLVRHGEYDWDSQPGPNKGLTSRGCEQARLTAKRLSSSSATVIYSSDLMRAVETAEIIKSELNGVPHETHMDLRECYLRSPGTSAVPAEHLEAGRKQAEGVFEKYLSASADRKAEIIVSHGNIIRFLTARVLGSSDHWFRMRTFNCGVTELDIDSGGRMWVVSYNDVGHLPAYLITEGLPSRTESA